MASLGGAGLTRSASDDGPEPAALACAHARRRGVKVDLVAGLDATGEARLDVLEADRCRQHDPALRGAPGQLRHREVALARERRSRVDAGAAAIGEQECA